MKKASILLCLGATVLLDCATLEPLGAGSCGNGVVDPGEDCDSFAPRHFTSGRCGAPDKGAGACRLACTKAADCPEGWGCAIAEGLDEGICRTPSGQFARLGEAVSAGVYTLVVGDFDGDGRKDIIGSGPLAFDRSAKARVHYFDKNGALSHVNALSAPIVTPAVQDFDGDGIDDFACGISDFGALGVFTGQRDRTLAPAIFPSLRVEKASVKTVMLERGRLLLPSGLGSLALYAGTYEVKKGTTATGLSSLGTSGYFHTLPVGAEGILGDPIWAPLRTKDPDSTCGEIALALADGSANGTIQVFSPCKPGPAGLVGAWANEREPITIVPPGPLEGGLHIADVDGDGNLDVMFGVKPGGTKYPVYVALGDGSAFAAPVETALPELPLASGDLDGDGRTDFVLPVGLALSLRPSLLPDAGAGDGGATPPPTGVLLGDFRGSNVGPRSRWTTALIHQLNDDGRPDVVAASDEQPDIDFLGGAGNDQFVQSTISTSGPVSRVAAGDFDGDGLDDVAFVQERAASGEIDVAIAYGRANGPPDAPRIAGRTQTKEALGLYALSDASAVQAIGLVSREEPATAEGLPGFAFSFIVGNGDRQPVAPLLLIDEVGTAGDRDKNSDITRQWTPLEVKAGRIGDPSQIDLLSLAVGLRYSESTQAFVGGSYPVRVWIAPSAGGTSFETPRVVQDLGAFAAGDRGAVRFDAQTVLGDLDAPPDGKEEIVAIRGLEGQSGLSLQVVRGGKGTSTMTTPVDFPGLAYRTAAPAAVIDVDSDGSADLVTIVGAGGEAKVVVFYNDGAAGLSSAPVEIAIPPAADGAFEAARGFALITTGGADVQRGGPPRRELAIVTTSRIVLASPKPGDRTQLEVRTIAADVGNRFAPTSIAAGDFDGDGVEDLAVADSGALRILPQVPGR